MYDGQTVYLSECIVYMFFWRKWRFISILKSKNKTGKDTYTMWQHCQLDLYFLKKIICLQYKYRIFNSYDYKVLKIWSLRCIYFIIKYK